MGYMHIDNLYRPEAQSVLLFKEVFAMEKIHGTSTHIAFNPTDNSLRFFSGGTKHDSFVKLFNQPDLIEKFKSLQIPVDREITVFGEGYGGKEQGMRDTYGPDLKFIAFDVKIGNRWLSVTDAEDVVKKLGLEFVFYKKVSTYFTEENGVRKYVELDAERDATSEQALRNGVVGFRKREGIVIRPPVEMTLNNGSRVMAKHKRDEFRETASPRVIVDDPSKLKVLNDAQLVASEWVTNERLNHVLDKIPDHDMTKIPVIIKAMTEDVLREGSGELVDSKEVRAALGKKTVELYKGKLNSSIGK